MWNIVIQDDIMSQSLTKDNIVDRVTMRSDMKSAAKTRSPSIKERRVLSQVSKVGGLKWP